MSNRLEYIDLLKVLSILAIITIHAFMVWQKAEVLNLNIYAFCQIVRFGVPVFVMISGALLLNREIELVSFFKKKVKRIIYPFIFFYFLTAFVIVFILNSTHNQVTNIFAFRWYFWMVLGIYLSLPVVNKFIQYSSMKEIEYFILIFIFASIFYQITYYFKIEQYLYLTLFLSPLGYLVLGYYLSRKEFNVSTNEIITISIILFILSTFVKICSHLGWIPLIDDFAANTSPILSSWLDVGLFEIIQASSLFLIGKYIYEASKGFYFHIKNLLQKNIISKFILSVSRASYGMYLINLIPTVMFYYLQPFKFTGTQIVLIIISLSIITFFTSWILIVLLSKIPFIKKFSGYY